MDGKPLIVATELGRILDDSDLRVLDCRFDLQKPAAGFAAYRNGHIPGAVYAHLDNDLAGPVTTESGRHPLPDVDTACETFGRLGVDRSTRVVVYDSGNGSIAARAWWLLRWLGHDKVRVLDGGFAAWEQDVGTVQSGLQAVRATQFFATPKDELILTTAEILAQGGAIANLRILDARDPARFTGEVEPIDTVAGHIPGTRNMPFSDALKPNGRWREERELRSMWAKQPLVTGELDWAVMCGSGVTACHLALSSALADCPEPRLYVGSWSEWIRDPNRPVGTGPSAPDAQRNAAEPA